tara:strand:+ start:428 stop:1423 length:996 start_codon:yes stop_codon:yes gene_type:complete
MAFKMKGSAFKLRSGNTSSFKMMGSSPARQVDPDAPGTPGKPGYEPPVTREDLDDKGKAIWDKLRGIGALEPIPSDTTKKTPPAPTKQTHEDTKKKAAKNDWDAGSDLKEGDYASYGQQAYDVKGNKIDFNAHEFTGPVIKNQNGRPYSEEEGNDKVIFWSGKSSSGTPASPVKHPIEDVILSGDGSKVTHRHDKKGKSHWVGKNGKDISKDVLKSLAGGGVNKKPFKQRSPNKHVVPNDAQGRNHTNPHEKTKGGGNVSYVTYDDKKKKKKEVKSTNDNMVRSRRKAPKKKKDTFYRDSNNDGSVVSRAIKKIKMPKIVMGGNGPYGNLK